MDQTIPVLRQRMRKRPPLPVVIGSIVLAVGNWVAVCVVAGRIVWFW
ncbi:hypothetical protein ACRBEV_09995 [Methylobacterium phyllosphaerae]|jgi:hypothetical protein